MKKIEPIGEVDPRKNLYVPLWVVYGISPYHPEIRAVCLNETYGGKTTLWGYSVYGNKAGYRTDGVSIDEWIERNTSEKMAPVFFNYQANALDYMRRLTEPKCGPLERSR